MSDDFKTSTSTETSSAEVTKWVWVKSSEEDQVKKFLSPSVKPGDTNTLVYYPVSGSRKDVYDFIKQVNKYQTATLVDTSIATFADYSPLDFIDKKVVYIDLYCYFKVSNLFDKSYTLKDKVEALVSAITQNSHYNDNIDFKVTFHQEKVIKWSFDVPNVLDQDNPNATAMPFVIEVAVKTENLNEIPKGQALNEIVDIMQNSCRWSQDYEIRKRDENGQNQ